MVKEFGSTIGPFNPRLHFIIVCALEGQGELVPQDGATMPLCSLGGSAMPLYWESFRINAFSLVLPCLTSLLIDFFKAGNS